MIRKVGLKPALRVIAFASSVAAQAEIGSTNWSLSFFLDADVGTREKLGFIPPSSDFGASFELPMWKRLELQGSASFPPDRKQITDDGHTINISGTQIFGSALVLESLRRFSITPSGPRSF